MARGAVLALLLAPALALIDPCSPIKPVRKVLNRYLNVITAP
jgi:hypothetical protein